uniref:Uncharacterized protein n=1 Tax=Anguilla anguilla TaxID=7936 RepID=A0A0E9XNU6_ANGAN
MHCTDRSQICQNSQKKENRPQL